VTTLAEPGEFGLIERLTVGLPHLATYLAAVIKRLHEEASL
jgi:hypothetical protein